MTGHVIVHIGAEKTGTTLLQDFLQLNGHVFAEQGVRTGDLLGDVNSHALAAYALTAGRIHDVHQWHGVTQANQEEFRAKFRERVGELLEPGLTYLFSNEHLSSRVVRSADIRRLIELFTDLDFTCQVVFFVRRQDAMIESSYSTMIKSGGTRTFNVTRSVTSLHRYDFADTVRRWSAQTAQTPRLSLFHEGCTGDTLTQQFVAACDLDWDDRFTIPDYTRNPSLDARTLDLLRAVNEAEAASSNWPFHRRTLVRDLESSSRSSGPRMTLAEREFVTDTFRSSNEALAPHLSSADIRELCAPPFENPGTLENPSALENARGGGDSHEDVLTDAQIQANFMAALAASVRHPLPPTTDEVDVP